MTLFTPVGREPGLPSPQAIWRKHARALSTVEDCRHPLNDVLCAQRGVRRGILDALSSRVLRENLSLCRLFSASLVRDG